MADSTGFGFLRGKAAGVQAYVFRDESCGPQGEGLLGFYAEQATRKHGHPHHILILVDSFIPPYSQAFLDISALLISGLSKTEADPSCNAPNSRGT